MEVESLPSKLQAKTANERLKAAKLIKKLAPSEARPLLLQGLGHWDRNLRKTCAETLVKNEGSHAVPEVIKMCTAGKLPVLFTIKTLARCECPEAITFLLKYVDHSWHSIRSAAHTVLARYITEEAALALFQAFSSFNRLSTARLLDKVSTETLFLHISSLPLNQKIVMLDSVDARNYFFKKRGMGSLYEEVDGPAGTLWRLAKDVPVSDIGIWRLDRLGDEQIMGFLTDLSPRRRRRRMTEVAMVGYLEQRNLLGRVPKAGKVLPVDKLSEKTGISSKQLGIFCRDWNSIDSRYKSFQLAKKSGGFRSIDVPDQWLKAAQKRVLENVLSCVPLHPCCHGFRRGCSTVTNSEPHTGREVVVNIDLKDFFPSVTAARVFGIFRCIGFDVAPARLLTRITTFEGKLPQGAPTSPTLANLACRRLDSRLAGFAKTLGATYSRYADDLTFSGNVELPSALPTIRKIITEENFVIADHKVRIARKGNRQEVTGLVVNTVVNLPRKVRRNLRAAIHRLSLGGQMHWKEEPMNERMLRGHLAYLNSARRDLASKYLESMTELTEIPLAPEPTH